MMGTRVSVVDKKVQNNSPSGTCHRREIGTTASASWACDPTTRCLRTLVSVVVTDDVQPQERGA